LLQVPHDAAAVCQPCALQQVQWHARLQAALQAAQGLQVRALHPAVVSDAYTADTQRICCCCSSSSIIHILWVGMRT
jgi:H2-forming N5,N10-methylenetetrahydromethanopterin dehydrogenase-like enzyme